MEKMMDDPEMTDMMKEMMGRGHMMGHMMGPMLMGRGPNMQGMMMPWMDTDPPACDDVTGHFLPRQCHSKGHCFCVDDRGMEIPGTRTLDIDGLSCKHNRTTSLNIEMMLKHHMDDMREHMNELRHAMEQQLSEWTNMDERWINIEAVIPDQNSVHVISVHIVVSHDGESDLPSIANFFQRQVQQPQAQIPFNDNFLIPDPDSVRIEHKFDEMLPPQLPDEHGPEEPVIEPEPPRGIITSCIDWHSFRNHRMTVVMGVVGIIVIMVAATGVALAAMKRRRMAMMQYQHRRFENMATLRENIVAANEMDLEKEEKKFVIDGDMQAPPLEEKVSIA
jgi:hypothetical protein